MRKAISSEVHDIGLRGKERSGDENRAEGGR
jgi:hypothetical protein